MHSGIIDLGQLLMASTAKYIDSAVFIDSSKLWTFSNLFMTNIASVHFKTQQCVSFNKTRSRFFSFTPPWLKLIFVTLFFRFPIFGALKESPPKKSCIGYKLVEKSTFKVEHFLIVFF